MKTVKERNEEAISRMKEKYQEQISKDSSMTIREVLELAEAVTSFVVELNIEPSDYSQVCHHLMAVVDTQEVVIGEQPRYKLISKYDWAMRNAIRDWNNRYEMGK